MYRFFNLLALIAALGYGQTRPIASPTVRPFVLVSEEFLSPSQWWRKRWARGLGWSFVSKPAPSAFTLIVSSLPPKDYLIEKSFRGRVPKRLPIDFLIKWYFDWNSNYHISGIIGVTEKDCKNIFAEISLFPHNFRKERKPLTKWDSSRERPTRTWSIHRKSSCKKVTNFMLSSVGGKKYIKICTYQNLIGSVVLQSKA